MGMAVGRRIYWDARGGVEGAVNLDLENPGAVHCEKQ